MDAIAFDARVRAFAVSPSRRSVASLLLAVPIVALWGATPSEGKKKRRHKTKKCKKKCGDCATCKKGKCKPKAAGIACSSGGLCLSNATCATTCDVDENCPARCKCSLIPSVEGPRRCIAASLSSCAQVPRVCTTSADCPRGEDCMVTLCGPGNTTEEPRCTPLCAA